jgi:hypothetical protein
MSRVHLALSRYQTSPEFRDAVERQASELVATELNRCDHEWHAAVASVKDTVAVLERTCDAFLSKTHTRPSGAAAHLVDRIVRTATDEAERAAERVRSEVGLQLATAQALADRLESELNVACGELVTTRERFESEHVARTRAEAERQDAQTLYQQMAVERESELQRQTADLETRRRELESLSQQLESARAERDALTAVLQSVQSTIKEAIVTAVVPPSSAPAQRVPSDCRADVAPHPAAVAPERTPVTAIPLAAPLATANDANGLQIQPRASEAASESDSTLAPYVDGLLKTAERKHNEDLESGLLPFEAADRLTSNLRDARDQVLQNMGPLYREAASVFETQLMRLIDTHGATTFGRHLGIAAYELDPAKAS